jgi:hypothetical protein
MASQIDTPGESISKAAGSLVGWLFALGILTLIALGIVAGIKFFWGLI